MAKRRNAPDARGPSGPLPLDPLIPPTVSFQQGLEDPSDQQELVIPALSVQPPSSSPRRSARQAKSKGKGPTASARPEGIDVDESDREESPDLPLAQSLSHIPDPVLSTALDDLDSTLSLSAGDSRSLRSRLDELDALVTALETKKSEVLELQANNAPIPDSLLEELDDLSAQLNDTYKALFGHHPSGLNNPSQSTLQLLPPTSSSSATPSQPLPAVATSSTATLQSGTRPSVPSNPTSHTSHVPATSFAQPSPSSASSLPKLPVFAPATAHFNLASHFAIPNPLPSIPPATLLPPSSDQSQSQSRLPLAKQIIPLDVPSSNTSHLTIPTTFTTDLGHGLILPLDMFTHERLTHYAAHPDEIPQPKPRNVNGVKVYAMDVSLKNESSLSYTDGMEAVAAQILLKRLMMNATWLEISFISTLVVP